MANYQTICDYLPADYSTPCSVHYYLKRFYDDSSKPATVVDLGCGEGNSIKLFQRLSGDTLWHGVDIENSPEVVHGQCSKSHAVARDDLYQTVQHKIIKGCLHILLNQPVFIVDRFLLMN